MDSDPEGVIVEKQLDNIRAVTDPKFSSCTGFIVPVPVPVPVPIPMAQGIYFGREINLFLINYLFNYLIN